jgi:hypothetical protein
VRVKVMKNPNFCAKLLIPVAIVMGMGLTACTGMVAPPPAVSIEDADAPEVDPRIKQLSSDFFDMALSHIPESERKLEPLMSYKTEEGDRHILFHHGVDDSTDQKDVWIVVDCISVASEETTAEPVACSIGARVGNDKDYKNPDFEQFEITVDVPYEDVDVDDINSIDQLVAPLSNPSAVKLTYTKGAQGVYIEPRGRYGSQHYRTDTLQQNSYRSSGDLRDSRIYRQNYRETDMNRNGRIDIVDGMGVDNEVANYESWDNSKYQQLLLSSEDLTSEINDMSERIQEWTLTPTE